MKSEGLSFTDFNNNTTEKNRRKPLIKVESGK